MIHLVFQFGFFIIVFTGIVALRRLLFRAIGAAPTQQRRLPARQFFKAMCLSLIGVSLILRALGRSR